MRVRYKPWAEDYLKEHPDLVDMDGRHAGHISEWFDKTTHLYRNWFWHGEIYNYHSFTTS